MAEAAAGKSKVTELRKKVFEESHGVAMEEKAAATATGTTSNNGIKSATNTSAAAGGVANA
jgi:hypothetical protein